MRLFAGRVYSGRLTEGVKDQFTGIVKRAFHEFVNDRVRDQLKSALSRASSPEPDEREEPDRLEPETGTDRVETTEDEQQGFYVVKAIVSQVVPPIRIFMRDTQSYCGVLVDDNNRKPICRLYFNGSQKYLGLLDAEKTVDRKPIDDVNDIFSYSEELKEAARRYV